MKTQLKAGHEYSCSNFSFGPTVILVEVNPLHRNGSSRWGEGMARVQDSTDPTNIGVISVGCLSEKEHDDE